MSENPNEVKNKFCSSCGEKLNDEVSFCPHCGTKAKESNKPEPKVVINNTTVIQNSVATKQLKDKWMALVLLLLFGALGVHKFYEGKAGMGVLYLVLLFSFVGIPFLALALFIDFIVILMKPNQYE